MVLFEDIILKDVNTFDFNYIFLKSGLFDHIFVGVWGFSESCTNVRDSFTWGFGPPCEADRSCVLVHGRVRPYQGKREDEVLRRGGGLVSERNRERDE